MDVGQKKSTDENQSEMMMDKIHELYGSFPFAHALAQQVGGSAPFLSSMNGSPCFPDNQEATFSASPHGYLLQASPNASNLAVASSVYAGSEEIHGEPSHPTPPVELLHGNNRKGYSMAAMREMIFRIAAMQPINIDPETVKPPKRRNVRISKDPQSVAARHRREKISERIRILQRLVPGGTKMDTASMLDEAIHYVKFLKNQVQNLECANVVGNDIGGLVSSCSSSSSSSGMGFSVEMSSGSYFPNMTPDSVDHIEHIRGA